MKIRLPRRLFLILPLLAIPRLPAILVQGAEVPPAPPVPPGMSMLSDPDLEVTV